MTHKLLYLIIILLLYATCMKEEYNSVNFNEQNRGVFIVNEGMFWSDGASLSYYNVDSFSVKNQVFRETNNGVSLGDVAQSITIRDSIGYVVVNNSGKIYALHTETFKYIGKITGLISPRYMHFINDSKAYVSDLYGQVIYIVNPLTLSVTGQIDVDNNSGQYYQHSTDQMIQYNEYVFINCWSYDNQILVINSNTDKLIDSIEVPIQPKAMVQDKFDNIWVLTDGGYEGNPYGHEQPSLIAIDPETRKIIKKVDFDIETSPNDIAINFAKDTVYFINGGLYRYPVMSENSPELFVESPYTGSYSIGFSAIGVDPVNNDIYLADALDNIQQGNIYRIRPSGVAIDTIKVGIIPTHFCFK